MCACSGARINMLIIITFLYTCVRVRVCVLGVCACAHLLYSCLLVYKINHQSVETIRGGGPIINEALS